jgi:hypothetical protein
VISPEDGLLPWSADEGIENIENLDTPVDQYSAWYRPDTTAQGERHGYVDAYYGLAYSERASGISGIYGLQGDLPEFSCDALANDGFLRVPFRRVPRRIVRSKEELLQIVGSVRSADPKITVLYRGQREEYVLPRSERAKLSLYGDASAREPSLIPSGLRKAVALDRVLSLASRMVFSIEAVPSLSAQGLGGLGRGSHAGTVPTGSAEVLHVTPPSTLCAGSCATLWTSYQWLGCDTQHRNRVVLRIETRARCGISRPRQYFQRNHSVFLNYSAFRGISSFTPTE